MDEQRGDVSSVRHRSSLAPTFFVICPAAGAGKLSTPYPGTGARKVSKW
jgi:hypothetical protein